MLVILIQDLVRLDREFNRTKLGTERRMKIYKGYKVEDFRLGDSVETEDETDADRNYVVTAIKDNGTIIELQKLDFFGHKIEGPKYEGALMKNQEGEWGWSFEEDSYVSIRFGTSLPKYGPKIEDINSPYLKYKTLPPDQQEKAQPEAGLIVSIGYGVGYERSIYYIESMTGSGKTARLVLRYIEGKSKVDNVIATNPNTKIYNKGSLDETSVTFWTTGPLGTTGPSGTIDIRIGSWDLYLFIPAPGY